MEGDPRATLNAAAMSRAQVAAVMVTMAISALDGFDVLSVTFAAPGIVAEFGIGNAALGLVLSMGLLGMAIGSLFLAPLADRLGRRTMVLVSLALMATGMFASAVAGSIGELSAWRVVTGCGIGAMVAVINPLAAEYANDRRRELAVGLMAVGYPIGGVVGGSIAAALLQNHGWRSVFVLGGVLACALLPFAIAALPESIAFLAQRRPSGALARINAIMRRFGHAELSSLPPLPRESRSSRFTHLFMGRLLKRTLTITAVNFLFVVAVYYFLSWLPQIVANSGFSASAATGVSVTANLVGVIGGLLLGWLAPRLGLKAVSVAALFGMGGFTILFGLIPTDLLLLRLSAGLTGFCLFGGIVGIYSVIARIFPVELRATGAGFVIGVGRGSSALAPAIAGFLLAADLGRGGVSIVMGGCALVAGLVLMTLRLEPQAPTGAPNLVPLDT